MSENLQQAIDLIYRPSNLQISSISKEKESQEYFAHEFSLNNYKCKYREGKVTPTKLGFFVTLWKRNSSGTTIPFSEDDNIDLYIIYTRSENRYGQYIFPKKALIENKILSSNKHPGKRGFRLYPPWINVASKQAAKSQGWQNKYFYDFSNPIKLKALISNIKLQ